MNKKRAEKIPGRGEIASIWLDCKNILILHRDLSIRHTTCKEGGK